MILLSKLKHTIESHFGLMLMAGALLGLLMPGLDRLPNDTAVVILALLMFTSCYRLSDGDFSAIRWGQVSGFWFLRYGVLPLVLWGIAKFFVPDLAVGVFLLSVLPAGVSSAAIANIYGGAVAPGFAIVILCQLTTPFLIPAMFALLGYFDPATAVGQVVPAPFDLFMTMVWCIFVPMLVYAFVRKQQHLRQVMVAQNKLFSMLLVAFVIAMVIAKQRDVLLSHLPDMAFSLVAASLCFISYMLMGWYYVRRSEREIRVTFAACSMFNNAALGVSLALLHFSPAIVLFVAVSEMAWAMLPILFGFFLRRF